MSQGLCVCGFIDSAPRVQAHQVSCKAFAEAYRAGLPGLDPAECYETWAAGGRKASRDAAHQVSVADTDRRRDAMAERFASHDLLED